MANGGGISESDVWHIAGQAIAPVAQQVDALQGAVGAIEHRLRGLEAEMGEVTNAIGRMQAALSHELSQLNSGNARLLELTRDTQQMSREQFIASNTQMVATNVGISGLNSTSQAGFQTLDAGVDRMAKAVVQTEVIRLLHEAKEPVDRANQFGTEIEQRFVKAVENVWFVRGQYDQLQGTAIGEYERKLRIIGEHIYAILDEAFLPAEEALSEPLTRPVELPLCMDEARLRARGEALNQRFAALGDELIEPLLKAHRDVEHLMASRFAGATTLPTGREVVLPAAVRIGPRGLEIVGQARSVVVPTPGAGADGSSQTLLSWESTVDPAIRDAFTSHRAAIEPQLRTQAMSVEQQVSLVESLRRLAAEGRIDPSLLPGYEAYLARFGLEVVAAQEVSG